MQKNLNKISKKDVLILTLAVIFVVTLVTLMAVIARSNSTSLNTNAQGQSTNSTTVQNAATNNELCEVKSIAAPEYLFGYNYNSCDWTVTTTVSEVKYEVINQTSPVYNFEFKNAAGDTLTMIAKANTITGTGATCFTTESKKVVDSLWSVPSTSGFDLVEENTTFKLPCPNGGYGLKIAASGFSTFLHAPFKALLQAFPYRYLPSFATINVNSINATTTALIADLTNAYKGQPYEAYSFQKNDANYIAIVTNNIFDIGTASLYAETTEAGQKNQLFGFGIGGFSYRLSAVVKVPATFNDNKVKFSSRAGLQELQVVPLNSNSKVSLEQMTLVQNCEPLKLPNTETIYYDSCAKPIVFGVEQTVN